MGVIKINNIIYGSNLASDIIYKNTTVEEKLNAIPVFDPSDNTYIEANQYDYLTYGHIINHLNSNDTDKALSANQGRVLSEKINNIEITNNENTSNISDINRSISNINTNVSNNRNLIDNHTNSINTLNNNFSSLWKPVKYSIVNSGSINLSANTAYIIFAHGNHWGNYTGLYLLYTGASANITTIASCSHLTISYSDYVLTIKYDSYGGTVDIIKL